MSPLLEPPAARPHATDPAPCLNRCSINNACFSATRLPGGQIGKRRVDERDGKRGRGGGGGGWVNEPVWREDMREGEWARTQKLEWLLGDGLATPEEAQGPVNLGMKSPPCPICSKDRQQRCLSLQVQPNIMILPHCEHGSVGPEMKIINLGKQRREKDIYFKRWIVLPSIY